MSVRSLGYRTDLMLRRMVGGVVEERDGYRVVRTETNPTFYWGNFLLFAAAPEPGEPQRWLSAFRAEFPHATHVAIGVDGVDGALGAADEMRALGLADDVSVVLTAAELTPSRQRDPGLDLRVPRDDGEWAQTVDFRIAVDEDDSARHRTFVERRAREFRSLTAAGHGVYVAAFVDGVARAGLGLFAEDGLARFQSVETHPDFRGRGLASTLLVEAARLVRAEHPVDCFVIVADPAYHAIDIYRRLGFSDTERQVQWQRSPTGEGSPT
jgi:ribosomal protein S18 acetylase RimI-like enzyme